MKAAAIGPRIAAGVVDAIALVAITLALAVLPLAFGGLTLPMLGAFAAILGWSIAPLVVFGSTLGMRLFGLELVGKEGSRADPGEIFFREMLGRGLLGFAYFATAIIGVVGWLSGNIGFFQPRGVGLVLFMISGSMVALAVAGHLVALASKDRRGLPDMMARTIVVERGSVAPAVDAPSLDASLDEEERAFAARARSRALRRFVIFEVSLVVVCFALPWALTRPSTGAEEFEARVRAAKRLQREKVEEKQAALRAELDRTREATLRATLAKDPTDWDAFSALLGMLDDAGRTAEARAAWEAYLAAEGSAETRASFGIWLYDNDLLDDAVRELRQAIAGGAADATAYAYLGWALSEKGDKQGARAAYAKALELDPSVSEELTAEYEALEKELGPARK